VWRPGRGSFAAVEKKTPVLDVGALAVQLGPGRPPREPQGESPWPAAGGKRKTILLSLLATTPVLSDAQQNIMAWPRQS